MSITRTVACGTCTACCVDDLIVLHPEDGDDIASYDTVRITHPFTGRPGFALRRNADRSCIYLDREGGRCTIHERRPAVCRSFDCGRAYERLGAARIKRMIARGEFSEAVARAGRMQLKNRRTSQHGDENV